ncbi:hypothetical protein PRZ48_001403 [Zasmidium cellare]|uniref:LisH domain-containing protein n=1 Tax=Zasmidium cellare TaxID=395010 RepID=A0ABR0F3K4_ZASCE|nr:hypothetical protein PRZ48_001403 [Zasmidium cellare]
MPASDSEILIVARYLKANNYTETYDAFVQEADLPFDAGNVSKGDLTLEKLLDEKKNFDVAVKFEKLGLEDVNSGWTKNAPSTAHEVTGLPTSSNILSARVESLQDDDGSSSSTLFASTADRKFHSLDASTRTLQRTVSDLHDAPVLSSLQLAKDGILTASMSGQMYLSDSSGKIVERRGDHSKYIVKIAALADDPSETYIATAGWDNKINVYKKDMSSTIEVGEPVARIPLSSKPEAILFVRHPDNNRPVLLASRTDSSFIFYYSVEEEPRLLGKQNLAPHSNAWVAFTPSSFELCPTDPSLLAVGTSSIPHMKLLIVTLLFPPWEAQPAPAPVQSARQALLGEQATETQASQARAALAIADREAAAIKIHCTTLAPQTAYSTPAVAWRPDGSGVWVNGDDGAIRGIEASTGKIVSTLKGHEPGTKVRCLWAGMLKDATSEKEVLVSGGFDHKLIVWEA